MSASLRTAAATSVAVPERKRVWLTRLGALFPRNAQIDRVTTILELRAPPEAVWQRILFYEEVPQRPARLLKLFLPPPVSTSGDKTKVGGLVHCIYQGGDLVKRITNLQPPRLMEFVVIEQHLGVEDSIETTDGSYCIRATPSGSEVTLTTNYRGHLRPRWLWRPLEQYLAHQVHRHILDGMRDALSRTIA